MQNVFHLVCMFMMFVFIWSLGMIVNLPLNNLQCSLITNIFNPKTSKIWQNGYQI